MGTNSHFRRNTAIVASIHLLVLALLFFLTRHPSEREIAWLDGGSPPSSTADAGADTEIVKPTVANETAPTPEPTPERERANRHQKADPESQIVLRSPKATPKPTPSPTPSPTPTATPTPTPAPTPEATATPKPTPRPTPKATPKPHAKKTPKPTPKPKPKKKPAPTPTPKPKLHQPAPAPDDESDQDAADDSAKAPVKTGESPKTEASPKSHASGARTGNAKAGGEGGSDKGKAGGSGTGAGGGHGAGHEGGGNRQSEFGWYYAMLHDRFYARWDQPISLLQGGQGFVTTILIQIEPGGRIGSLTVCKSSGNTTMDDSVMTAARRVIQVDPPPGGLGSGEVKIEFKLNP